MREALKAWVIWAEKVVVGVGNSRSDSPRSSFVRGGASPPPTPPSDRDDGDDDVFRPCCWRDRSSANAFRNAGYLPASSWKLHDNARCEIEHVEEDAEHRWLYLSVDVGEGCAVGADAEVAMACVDNIIPDFRRSDTVLKKKILL